MSYQYPLRRKDPHYTQPLIPDTEFFGAVLQTDLEELTEVKSAAAEGDIARATQLYLEQIRLTSHRRFYYGVEEIPTLVALIRENYPAEEINAVIGTAQRLVDGEFEAFTMHATETARIHDGHYPWVDGQDKDVVPRFQFLDTITHGYALTRDPKIAGCYAAMIADFLRECPIPRDATFRLEHGAWHPLTAAIRIFSWAPAFVGFLDAAEWPADEKLAMVKSFHQHGSYIREHHAANGNHALMQMRALILIALLFPEFRESGDWLRYALERFPPMVAENVYPDGVQFEGSPAYHMWVMRDLFGIIPLLRRGGLEVPAGITGPLEKMFEVLMHLITPDMDLPTIGDTVSSKGSANREFNLGNIMATGALLFQRTDFRYLAPPRFPLEYLWNFGPTELASYRALVPEKPAKATTYFPTGGYMISREGWDDPAGKYLAMRAGVGLGGHCHSDALTIVACAFGKELVVDSGKGIYEWTPERKYLVSTRAHNTVVVDGQDQHTRNFHWGPSPSAPCHIWDFRSNDRYDFFFASHYGYARFDDPVIHTRKVLFVKNRYWLIIDLLHAKSYHKHDLYFHLPVGEVCANADLSQIRTAAEEGNILIFRAEDEALQTSIEESLVYNHGDFHANPAVKYSQSKSGPVRFVTVLAPFKNQPPKLSVKKLSARINGQEASDNDATAIAITCDGATDRICINHTSTDVTRYLDYNGNPVGVHCWIRGPIVWKSSSWVTSIAPTW